jgi:hypothetical protein
MPKLDVLPWDKKWGISKQIIRKKKFSLRGMKRTGWTKLHNKVQVISNVFWWWHNSTLGITGCLENTFRKWKFFRVRWQRHDRVKLFLMNPTVSKYLIFLPEDGNRSSFRNVQFFWNITQWMKSRNSVIPHQSWNLHSSCWHHDYRRLIRVLYNRGSNVDQGTNKTRMDCLRTATLPVLHCTVRIRILL